MSSRLQACRLLVKARRRPHGLSRLVSTAPSEASQRAQAPDRPASSDAAASAGRSTTHFGFRDVAVEEKEQLVKGVFNSVASQYDLMNDLMSGGLHRLWKDEFVRMSGIKAGVLQQQQPPSGEEQQGAAGGMKLLDVAGGTGDIAFRLMKTAHDSLSSSSAGQSSSPLPLPSITICDINAEMLKVGRARSKRHFAQSPEVLQHLEWVEGNAECLPFPDRSFDLYTIAFGLRNVTNREKALQEAFRVLKRGGRFMCLEFSHVSLPGVQQAYDLYSFEVIPRVGEAVTGDRAAYQYLVESIRKFPRQEALVNEVAAAGFGNVTYTNFTLGTVAVHSGFRWN